MIYVIGIGPGGKEYITPKALDTLKACDVVLGYNTYIDLIYDLLLKWGKFIGKYPMRQERQRCLHARELSRDGYTVGLISSGDAGVYGMAGLMLELAEGEEVRIVPGITASNSCAAVLGAPLMNDYASISLSDLMTDWKDIIHRIRCACMGDFVICIYNPASHHRPDNFKNACDMILRYRNPETPAGYVRNAGRDGETYAIMTLEEIKQCKDIDMSCTVIIGNSKSYILDGKIITPRGYKRFSLP